MADTEAVAALRADRDQLREALRKIAMRVPADPVVAAGQALDISRGHREQYGDLGLPGDGPRVSVHPASYPDCGGCGHNASGVVAGRCTAFVPYPEGDPRGMAGYCGHACVNDPAIRGWMSRPPGALFSADVLDQAGPEDAGWDDETEPR